MNGWRVIGIDCAVDPAKVGVAAGEMVNSRVMVTDATQCGKNAAVEEAVATYAAGANRVLLALDAPLGWPAALGRTIVQHQAGQPIVSNGHALFRRRTDEVVAREVGHTPLDVGANLIARTAVAALADLEAIRRRLGVPIPLAWTAPPTEPLVAIEVYPAATLRQLRIKPSGYKKSDGTVARLDLIEKLAPSADLTRVREACAAHADTFDAAVCVIAGFDFLVGSCYPVAPEDAELALHEGWIWFRRKRVVTEP